MVEMGVKVGERHTISSDGVEKAERRKGDAGSELHVVG
jgi:hypothetical protein